MDRGAGFDVVFILMPSMLKRHLGRRRGKYYLSINKAIARIYRVDELCYVYNADCTNVWLYTCDAASQIWSALAR